MKTLVAMPGHAELSSDAYQTAIVPPSTNITAKQTVTYGLGPKNTITFSSVSEDGCLLSLQRDIVAQNGMKIEQQEIKIPPLKSLNDGLCAAGALLLSGCAPENLYSAMEPLGL